MSDRVNLMRRVESLNHAPEFDGITKLICNIDDETQMTVGDDAGYALEFDNPLMTQTVLAAMLAKIRSWKFKPYEASGALLDPAAEMGDAVSIKDVYGGIFNRERSFSRLMKADISAPADEEIDHEYKFETKQERKVKRQFGDVRATLLIQADKIEAEVAAREADSEEFRGQLSVQATQIAAKVSQTGGDNSSFGWSLLANEFGLYAGNTKVFYVNQNGAYVNGEIQATKGKIGGFVIGASAIYNNLSTYGGSQTNGVYIGTNGIQLGQNFQVDTSGNVKANNITLTGTLNVGGTNISASTLRSGAQVAYDRNSAWNGTTNTVNSNGGTWSTGAGYGYDFNNASQYNTSTYRSYFRATTISAAGSFSTNGTMYCGNLYCNGTWWGPKTIVDGNGNSVTVLAG